ncbi:hypothetical protein TSAR_011402 [Trichomalopsis sarcophagae]|uniref:Core-binding (CB) domain-containing protein n=1 Tax=Trichomalopsis sarcophagae TaxID=543379 RepID=A0A232EFV6_9HYME|nr:hypothetical protein TSAR_011402 [Trichomalopsis sarcophagae]
MCSHRSSSLIVDPDSTNSDELPLNEKVLDAIGKRVIEEKVYGPPLHSELAVRWQDIIKQGLPDDEKQALIKKYPLPENCKFSEPPKLNPELKAVMHSTQISRDAHITGKQEKIVGCLAAVTKAMSALIQEGPGEPEAIRETSLDNSVGCIAGRLKEFLNEWKAITSDAVVLSWINGYKIPFDSKPFQHSIPMERDWTSQKIKIREFAKVLGTLVSYCVAVNYGFVYTKACEREKCLALEKSNNNYEAHMIISKEIKDELKWWNSTKNLTKNPIKRSTYDLEIFTDASLTGWGGFSEGEKKAQELRGVPKETMEIMMPSITDSSHKQYEACFKKWWEFCARNELNPFQSDVPNILKFLTELYNNGSGSSTINCYRSAISLLVGPDAAQDNRMKRVFKGLPNLRPSKPKYDVTWDPKIVLDYFSPCEDNSQLDIKSSTMKVSNYLVSLNYRA